MTTTEPSFASQVTIVPASRLGPESNLGPLIRLSPALIPALPPVMSSSAPYDRLDSGPASESHTPVRSKGKKRVGWHSSSNSAGAVARDTPDRGDYEHVHPTIIYDRDSVSPQSPHSTPSSPSGAVPHGAPDPIELTSAIQRAMSHENLTSGPAIDGSDDPSPPVHQLRVPAPPRPALRRESSYGAQEERDTADEAEKRASHRQQRSISDARHRADRLADSLGSSAGSGPAPRRHSREPSDAFQPQLLDPDQSDRDEYEGLGTPPVGPTHPGPPADGHHLRRRARSVRAAPEGRDPSQHDEPSRHGHTELAETLVRTYTRSSQRDLFHPGAGRSNNSSGTNTPIPVAEDGEYVPKPHWYRGGVLASLLKLQRDRDERRSGNSSSGQNTPSAPASPVTSPGGTPPSSRPPSVVGSPRPRPASSGSFFGLHRSSNNQWSSSTTLTELLKTSSMLTAPGAAGEVTADMAGRLRKDKTHNRKSKSKKDQIRITVHIAGIIARHRYLLKLCRALMMYGAPTHRLEEYMAMSARVLEIEGQFLYIPSCMIISFDDSTTHTAEVKLVRVPQGIDLGRLRDVHNIYKDVVHDKLGVEEATRRLEAVMQRGPKFNKVFRVFMYGIASACVAPFAFEGRFIDLPIAFLLGCILGILQLVFAPSNELYAHVFEVTAAIVTSFLARGFGSLRNGQLFCFSALAQSSIALILPGYMVLCSSLELQSHNIVAGSVRMVYAMIYTLFLGYGITIGASLYGMLDSNATSRTTCINPMQRDWYLLFVPCFAMCLCIINQAQWKQTPVMVVMALAGYCVNSYSSKYFEDNSQISNMLGALTVGILANLYSRVGRHCWNTWLDVVDYWNFNIRPRLARRRRVAAKHEWPLSVLTDTDVESGPASPDDPQQQQPQRQPRQIGYSLAAAAMLPAIFVQVPSGLAAGGSLLAGITSANQITGNATHKASADGDTLGDLNGTAFNVLLSVIQVAIGISVGLFMSALIVYPLGKRRSGLFSF